MAAAPAAITAANAASTTLTSKPEVAEQSAAIASVPATLKTPNATRKAATPASTTRLAPRLKIIRKSGLGIVRKYPQISALFFMLG
jgi:hypothetical protein